MDNLEKLDSKTNRIFNKLPTKVKAAVLNEIETLYEEMEKKRAFIPYQSPITRDTILALRMLTLSGRALIITHSE